MRLFFWKSCNEILIVSSYFLLLKKVSLAQGRNVFLHPSNIWDCQITKTVQIKPPINMV